MQYLKDGDRKQNKRISNIVMKAIQYKPKKRYATVKDFYSALEHAYEYKSNKKTYRYHVATMLECIGLNGKAKKLYQKAAAVGDSRAMCNLGVMYFNGRGVEQDDSEAVKWYKKSAEGGNSSGMLCLGKMYENGRGVEQDDGEAVKWYRKAAEAGNSEGMSKLEYMHQYGLGGMFF